MRAEAISPFGNKAHVERHEVEAEAGKNGGVWYLWVCLSAKET